MSPTLDRDEIAVRLACALIARDGYDDEGAPRDAVTLADALLAALASKNAATGAPEALEPDVPEGSTIAQLAAEQRASMGLTASMGATQHFKHDATPAPEAKRAASRGWTDEQKAAHRAEFETWARGLDMNTRRADKGSGYDDPLTDGAWLAWEDRVPFSATPAPEAKRPEWVRIVKSESPSRFKDGDVLRVVKWVDEVPAVDVDGYDVSGYVLYDSKWAPAPCPPPVAGSVDDDAPPRCVGTCHTATWCEAGRACLSVTLPQDDLAVAERILAVARKATPPEVRP